MFISNVRLIIENLQAHGLVAHLPSLSSHQQCLNNICTENNQPHMFIQFFQSIGSWVVCILIVYSIEIIRHHRYISESLCVFLHFIFGGLNIIVPIMWVWISSADPILCMIYLFQAVILWMKLISYVHVNHDLRSLTKHLKLSVSTNTMNSSNRSSTPTTPTPTTPTSKTLLENSFQFQMKLDAHISKSNDVTANSMSSRSNEGIDGNSVLKSTGPMDVNYKGLRDLEPPILQYPANLTLLNIIYFCFAPTLCYQLNYPRSLRVRWPYVFSLLIRLVLFSCFMLFAVQQYILPTLALSVDDMKEKNFIKISEIISRLSIPNTYVWLLMFYTFFHLWLNLLAELTRFGDRLFYKDWFV